MFNISDATTPTQLSTSQCTVAHEDTTPTQLSSSQHTAAREKEMEQIMLLNPYQKGILALHTAYSNSSLSLRAYLVNTVCFICALFLSICIFFNDSVRMKKD
jgi:hypothetical protein